MASARVQRCALTFKLLQLQHYLQARRVHINADMMSTLALATSMDVSVTGDTVILLETLQSSPMTASSLKPLRPNIVKGSRPCQ